MLSLKRRRGLPWWYSGWESACQCRGHGFEPWSGRFPHAAEQLGPWATTTAPARLEPVLRNWRGRNSERPAHCEEEWPPPRHSWRKPSHRNEDPTQPKINKLKKKKCWWLVNDALSILHANIADYCLYMTILLSFKYCLANLLEFSCCCMTYYNVSYF